MQIRAKEESVARREKGKRGSYGGGGGGGGGGGTPPVFLLRAEMPPARLMIFRPESIDNNTMTVPQVCAKDGLLYIMIAPSIVASASTVS